MSHDKAMGIARRRYGDCAATVTGQGDCVISVRNRENQFVPLGFGSTWDEAVLDCARNAAFADELCYV